MFCRSLLITPHWLLLVRPLALSVLCFDVPLFLGVLSGWFVRRRVGTVEVRNYKLHGNEVMSWVRWLVRMDIRLNLHFF